MSIWTHCIIGCAISEIYNANRAINLRPADKLIWERRKIKYAFIEDDTKPGEKIWKLEFKRTNQEKKEGVKPRFRDLYSSEEIDQFKKRMREGTADYNDHLKLKCSSFYRDCHCNLNPSKSLNFKNLTEPLKTEFPGADTDKLQRRILSSVKKTYFDSYYSYGKDNHEKLCHRHFIHLLIENNLEKVIEFDKYISGHEQVTLKLEEKFKIYHEVLKIIWRNQYEARSNHVQKNLRLLEEGDEIPFEHYKKIEHLSKIHFRLFAELFNMDKDNKSCDMKKGIMIINSVLNFWGYPCSFVRGEERERRDGKMVRIGTYKIVSKFKIDNWKDWKNIDKPSDGKLEKVAIPLKILKFTFL